MFSLFNGIYDSYLAPTQLNLLIVGPPNAGKSALLERLKVTEIPTRPTKASNNDAKHNAEDLTQALQAAFVETGATEGSRKSSFSAIATGGATSASPEEINRRLAAAEAAGVTAAPSSNSSAKPSTTTKPRRRFLRLNICPAPERYLKSAQDQDEDFIDDEEEQKLLRSVDNSTKSSAYKDDIRNELSLQAQGDDPFSSDPPRRVRCHSKEFDVDSLDLMDGRRSSMQDIPLSSSGTQKVSAEKQQSTNRQPLPTVQVTDLHQPSAEEFYLKPNAKMLSLTKIRPTIGSNLAKLDMYGAKCHIFDVGGRLQDLWERYYDDCDAVVFCWKLGEDPDKAHPVDDDSKDENDDPQNIYKKQQKMLNDVRKAIPDDIPFLVFGHIFGNANVDVVDQMYSTDLILPRYHNPMTGLCCGSAKTGAGVQAAMEWLIPLAKRQQKERLTARKQMEEKVL